MAKSAISSRNKNVLEGTVGLLKKYNKTSLIQINWIKV